MTFYDRTGKPVAYTEDEIQVYLFTGEPAAYFAQDAVYGFNGRQFGWFDAGWIRDLNGKCVFYSENSSGSGPVKPVKQICTVKCVKHVMPVKCVREVLRVRAVNQLSWSGLSGTQFFTQ